ncbi:hypothetical protein IPH92_03430 [Candidatus Kaiserbacteria bacterium]|nr:MAG: hypothetical protein IPH92_03430 [Candidatus Kaiserbacteria bacterium]
MTITVCLKGTQKIRLVPHHGGYKLTYPFIGITGTGESGHIGLGSFTVDLRRALFWGPKGHHKLVPIWRAMKILEMVDTIGDTTLTACWALFHPETRCVFDTEYIKELAEQFHGEAGFIKAYNSVAHAFPSLEDFDTLMSKVRETGIRIETDELFDTSKKNLSSPQSTP